MKYINYIVNGRPIRPEEFGIVAIIPAMVGLIFLTVTLAPASIMDLYRYGKLNYILKKREWRRDQHAINILNSLGHKETEKLISTIRYL